MSSGQDSKPLGYQVPLCRVDDIPDGGARAVSVNVGEQWDLLLLRQGERVFAYHNECTHAGRKLDYAPGRFLIDQGCIVCPAHGATFAIDSGACCSGPATGSLKAVPIRLVDGAVWLEQACGKGC